MVKKSKVISPYLWDTGALSLYFADHYEAKEIMKRIQEGKVTGYVPSLVLVEFFYKQIEKSGLKTAEHRLRLIRESKNTEIGLDQNRVTEIGLVKFSNRNMSIVDCVISVLSKKFIATIVTTDGDFDNLDGVKSVNLSY